jgi:DNA-binding MarR family transcriptional regulator
MRESTVEELYQALTTFLRLRSEIAAQTHPGLSLVAYTLLTTIDSTPDIRATDLTLRFGLDKSTLSRQIDQLEARGLIQREGERPGRRGQTLAVTSEGRRQLDAAADQARRRLIERLVGWDEQDIATLASLVERFNRTFAVLG